MALGNWSSSPRRASVKVASRTGIASPQPGRRGVPAHVIARARPPIAHALRPVQLHLGQHRATMEGAANLHDVRCHPLRTAAYRNELARRLRQFGYSLGVRLGVRDRRRFAALISQFSKRSKERDAAVARSEQRLGRKLSRNEIAHVVHQTRPKKIKGARMNKSADSNSVRSASLRSGSCARWSKRPTASRATLRSE